MFLKDWREKLDAFLQFNGQEILQNAGNVAKNVADKLALEKYEDFHHKRLIKGDKNVGDIDEAVKKLNDF